MRSLATAGASVVPDKESWRPLRTQCAAEQHSPGAGVSLGRAPTPASDSLSHHPGSRQWQLSNALRGPMSEKIALELYQLYDSATEAFI